MTRTLTLLTLLLSPTLALAQFGDGGAGQTPPNILLVILDDVGVDKVDPYTDFVPTPASYQPSTPTLQDLSDAGLRFTNAWANPTCTPTRAALFTGLHPHTVGLGHPTATGDRDLDPATATIPEVLRGDTDGSGTVAQEHGETRGPYVSGLFGKWHLGDPDGFDYEANAANAPQTRNVLVHPIRSGWDVFVGNLQGSVGDYFDWTRLQATRGTPQVEYVRSQDYVTDETLGAAQYWINQQTSPWFATLALHASHTPYTNTGPLGDSCTTVAPSAPDGLRTTLECADVALGGFLDTLESRGQLDNTYIVVIGDNGTATDAAEGSFAARGRGKTTAYETGIRVPLTVTAGPNYIERASGRLLTPSLIQQPGRDVDHPVHAVDLHATIADLGGAAHPEAVHSVSMKPYLDDASARPQREYTYAEHFAIDSVGLCLSIGAAALRYDSMKLVARVNGSGSLVTELYDLSTDFFETNDLYSATVGNPYQLRLESELAAMAVPWLSVPVCPPESKPKPKHS